MFMMLCIVKTHIASRKRKLSQKVFKLFYALLCLLIDRSHRSGTLSAWLFSVIFFVLQSQVMSLFQEQPQITILLFNVNGSE